MAGCVLVGRKAVLALLVGAPLVACRQDTGTEQGFEPIPVSGSGSQGCSAVQQPIQLESLGTFPWVGPSSQIAAVRGEDIVYVTGGDARVVELDVSTNPPGESMLVLPGVIDSIISFQGGISTPAEISGVAVLDETSLLVVENTSNTVLLVSRLAQNAVIIFAGFPSQSGGFSDGFGSDIRFNFDRATQILTTDTTDPNGGGLFSNSAFIADPGNHAIRLLTLSALPLVDTVAGTGAPNYDDGDLSRARFDTPTGLTVSCIGELLITERGSADQGGLRLRSLMIGEQDLNGNYRGTAATIAGDGEDDSIEGAGGASSLAVPVSPVSTSDGQVFWMDARTGILRRYSTATGIADCPLASDCASAGGNFSFGPDADFSLAIGADELLYVLDSGAGELFRVTP